MGMFDTILLNCPSCGRIKKLQTKSGPCDLKEYAMHKAPASVLVDLDPDYIHTCESCGTKFKFTFELAVLNPTTRICTKRELNGWDDDD